MSKSAVAWDEHPLLAERRQTFLGSPFHALTMDETLAVADEAIRLKQPLHHVVVNVAKIVTMRSNAELNEDVATADIVNVDGQGVVWGARLCGLDVPEKVSGVDIMLRMFDLCEQRGYGVFLLGAEQSILDAVIERLSKDHPKLVIAGARNGYFKPEDEQGIVAEIDASGADCLFVAMPTPRKERFIKRYRDVLSPSFVMGVGGSFDVYGGKVSRAPKFVQAAGMEWLFRLAQEPRRLWRRYYDTNKVYAALLARELWNRHALRKS